MVSYVLTLIASFLLPAPSSAINALPTARSGVAPFALSYGNRSSLAGMYAPRYQLMTSNFTENVQAMHGVNPSLPLLGYIEQNLQPYEPWCAEAQPLEDIFLHAGDPASLTAIPWSGTVRLAWLPDGRTGMGYVDCAGYNVYRRAGTDSTFELLTPSPVTGTSFTDTGLTDGADYSYKVTSVDRTRGDLTFSGVVQTSPGTPTVSPIAPVSVSVASGTNGGTVAITVSAAPFLTGVDLVLDTDHSLTFEPTERVAMTRTGSDGFGFALYSAQVTITEPPHAWGLSGFSWYVEAAPGNVPGRMPAAGCFSTNANNRIQSRGWGCWIMDPGNQTWRNILASGAHSLMTAGYDGIFIDVGVPTLAEWWPDAVPPDQAVASWQPNTHVLMADLKSAVSPGSVIFNGLSSQALTYLDATDGAMVEGFVVSPWSHTGWSEEATWKELMNVGLATGARGATQLNYAIGPESSVSLRLYSLASHLMIANVHAFFTYDGGCNCPTYFPEWDLQIGDPLETFTDIDQARRPSGLYGRRMSGGLVLVNPSQTETMTEILDTPMALAAPSGNVIAAYGGNGTISAQWVTRVTLGPQQGAILLDSWSGDTMPPQQAVLTLAPNPAGAQVTLSIEQAVGGRVRVALYDVRGRQVAPVLDTTLPAGRSSQVIDLTPFKLRAGMYALVSETAAGRASRTLIFAP